RRGEGRRAASTSSTTGIRRGNDDLVVLADEVLNQITTEARILLGEVADLAVLLIVVPAERLVVHIGIGHRFGNLVRRDGGKLVEGAAEALRAGRGIGRTGIRQHGVTNVRRLPARRPAGKRAVIAEEAVLAGVAAELYHDAR